MTTRRNMGRLGLFLVAMALAVLALGCPKKKGGDPAGAEPDLVVRDDSTGLLLTWIDDKGGWHTAMTVAEVPPAGREIVRVRDPAREDGVGPGKAFVADLRSARPDGTYPVKTMTRDEFEAIAVARREKYGPTLASAAGSLSARPPDTPAPTAPETTREPAGSVAVIIYGASWCGACHQAADYLRRKGVSFVEKDVEKDSAADQEMGQKLARAGKRAGTIPVLDVRGRILVGFSAAEVDDALGKAM